MRQLTPCTDVIKFEVVNEGERARYDGPHGPLWISVNQDPATAVLQAADSEDRLEFGMARRDLEALDAGVRVRIDRVDYQLRRDGKTLVLLDASGRPQATAKRARLGRLKLERPDGRTVAQFLGPAGKVDEQISALEVRLMLLLALSGSHRAIERGGGSLLPFP
jgi:hypothetical protein